MATLSFNFEIICDKLARSFAYKAAGKDKSKVDGFFRSFKRDALKALQVTEHFCERIAQRFLAEEYDTLAAASARAIRNTFPLEVGRGYHAHTTQKYYDETTNIVVVLERRGTMGAILITTYKRGEENLLSDEELAELKRKGVTL